MGRPAPRLTTRRLMALVVVLGVGLAIVRHAWASWGGGEVLTLSLAILLGTNVLAWFQGPRWQVFWVGFGLAGWAYLAVALGSPLGAHLPTTRLIREAYDRRHLDRDPWLDEPPGFATESEFRVACQAALALAFAPLGGVAARLLARKAGGGRGGPPPADGSLLGPGWREGMPTSSPPAGRWRS